MRAATIVRFTFSRRLVWSLVLAAVVCGGWLAVMRAAEPAPALPRSAPEAQGVSSAKLLEFVEAADQQLDAMHSVMVIRHGQVVAEGWWAPYGPEVRHTLYSLTKSFTSTAIGLAQAEGRLSINDPVLKFFPDRAPAVPSENLKALRVRDLLSMSTGHHVEPPLRTTVMGGAAGASSNEWTRAFLDAPVDHKPGTLFLYNTPASYMLSAILQKVTGEKAVDYLKPRLFEPLGISDIDWETSPENVSIGGYGLHLRTESIARFGLMLLQKGKWQGRQVVPAEWVETATRRQVSNGSNPDSDWEQGYGFQFWRMRHDAFRGDGAFGQFCLVLPEQDAVVAITSGVKNLQAVLDLVFAKLLPALSGAALPADATAQAALTKRLSGLALHTPKGNAQPGPKFAWGRKYVFPENTEKIEALAIERGADGVPVLVTRVAGVEQKLPVPHGRWATTTLPAKLPVLEQQVAGSGAWLGEETLLATVAYYETPFKLNVRISFDADTAVFEREMHVGFGDTRRPTLVGKAQIEAPATGRAK